MTDTLADKLNPRKHGYSPKMTAIVGAIIGHDYGVRDPRGGKLMGLTITSDCFVTASTTSHESGVFVGTYLDFANNLSGLLARVQLTPEEKAEYDRLYKQHVTDWGA